MRTFLLLSALALAGISAATDITYTHNGVTDSGFYFVKIPSDTSGTISYATSDPYGRNIFIVNLLWSEVHVGDHTFRNSQWFYNFPHDVSSERYTVGFDGVGSGPIDVSCIGEPSSISPYDWSQDVQTHMAEMRFTRDDGVTGAFTFDSEGNVDYKFQPGHSYSIEAFGHGGTAHRGPDYEMEGMYGAVGAPYFNDVVRYDASWTGPTGTFQFGNDPDHWTNLGTISFNPYQEIDFQSSGNWMIDPASATGVGTLGWRVLTPETTTYRFQAVPEPGSIAALGLGVIAFVRRRRK